MSRKKRKGRKVRNNVTHGRGSACSTAPVLAHTGSKGKRAALHKDVQATYHVNLRGMREIPLCTVQCIKQCQKDKASSPKLRPAVNWLNATASSA